MYNVVNNDCDKDKLDQNMTRQCIPGTVIDIFHFHLFIIN